MAVPPVQVLVLIYDGCDPRKTLNKERDEAPMVNKYTNKWVFWWVGQENCRVLFAIYKWVIIEQLYTCSWL